MKKRLLSAVRTPFCQIPSNVVQKCRNLQQFRSVKIGISRFFTENVARNGRKSPIFGQKKKNAPFCCKNANLPNRTRFTRLRGGGVLGSELQSCTLPSCSCQVWSEISGSLSPPAFIANFEDELSLVIAPAPLGRLRALDGQASWLDHSDDLMEVMSSSKVGALLFSFAAEAVVEKQVSDLIKKTKEAVANKADVTASYMATTRADVPASRVAQSDG